MLHISWEMGTSDTAFRQLPLLESTIKQVYNPDGDDVLRVWTAEIVEGEPRALEHLALRWLGPSELYEVSWLPGDLPVIDLLHDHLR